VIRDVIRGQMGFDGLLMSDDLSMKALSGSFTDRRAAVLAEGCDLVLHCNGEIDEMEPIAAGCPAISTEASRRLKVVLSGLKTPMQPFDRGQAEARLAELLATGA
ncbi:MAG TPA: glycoside hydrolase family 3 N-terminal domain-containing protein, partial [Rhabdaerophilum sp.]|nr:glycoside hydrolase family 3 N-terminal domain-containing protein [Rhabdaerophilum sp.]